MSFEAKCTGLVQTNQRAELLAVVLACLRDPRPLNIRTDSDYVCKGVTSLDGLATGHRQGDHADLWSLLDKEFASRSSAVKVTWVKGHVKQIDVTRGRCTKEDKEGNDGADALARAGAQLHAIPAEVLEAAQQRRHWATSVQQMMVTIVHTRQLAEQGVVDGSDMCDRGSDTGDDVFDTDNSYSADTEIACACIDHVLSDDCMGNYLLNSYATGTAAQQDMPEDTLDVEGCLDSMHEHVVHINSLDDEFDMGFD